LAENISLQSPQILKYLAFVWSIFLLLN
jgi:hypothetical protein